MYLSTHQLCLKSVKRLPRNWWVNPEIFNTWHMTYRRITVFWDPGSATCLPVIWLQTQPAHNLPDMSKPPPHPQPPTYTHTHTNFGAIRVQKCGTKKFQDEDSNIVRSSKFKFSVNMIYLWGRWHNIIFNDFFLFFSQYRTSWNGPLQSMES